MKTSKKEIISLFNKFDQLAVLIIGDVMLDNYLVGNSTRLSPEAPVPIVQVSIKESRPGGAANVAVNIKSLGAKPILCSIIGEDWGANQFIKLCEENGFSTEGILKSNTRTTTIKTRIIGNNHHLLRVDEEVTSLISPSLEKKLLAVVNEIIQKKKINVIIFQDYDKGTITPWLIKEVVAVAKARKIPVAVDPKKRNFLKYKNVDLFKPNFKELKEGLNLDLNSADLKKINEAINSLMELIKCKAVSCTLSEKGVFVKSKNVSTHIPGYIRNVADVCGAGDTVISVASLLLALKTDLKLNGEISNISGGLVCEQLGVVPIDKKQLLEECFKLLT